MLSLLTSDLPPPPTHARTHTHILIIDNGWKCVPNRLCFNSCKRMSAYRCVNIFWSRLLFLCLHSVQECAPARRPNISDLAELMILNGLREGREHCMLVTCHKQLWCAGWILAVLVTRTQYGPPGFWHEGVVCF